VGEKKERPSHEGLSVGVFRLRRQLEKWNEIYFFFAGAFFAGFFAAAFFAAIETSYVFRPLPPVSVSGNP
jgi:hypothetical protein